MSKTERGTETYDAFDGGADADVVVLGVGTCGEDLSLRLLGAGLRVVGIEAALVGATAAGPHGGEMLGLLTLAVHARVALADLRSMIYAFPTFHGGIGEAVGAYGRGLATVLDPAYQGLEVLDGVGLPKETDGRLYSR